MRRYQPTSTLAEYAWDPQTGIATLTYEAQGALPAQVVRVHEPTSPKHPGWADDPHAFRVRKI